MHAILRFVLICQLMFSIGMAQEGQVSSLQIGMGSPTAASLGQYGDVPVSLYTGTPNISIPLYELPGRHLSLPIGLSYHASGIKVETIPGWVGSGWSLNAGGVITRTVKGVPDDHTYGYHNTAHRLDDNNSQNWTPTPTQQYINELKAELADSEPDMFFLNFPGGSGRFVYGPEEEIHTIPYQKIRIEPTEGVGDFGENEVLSWKVTTADGTIYEFEATEYTTNTSISTSISGSAPRTYISSWYLTRIVSPKGDDEISFEYSQPGLVMHKSRTYRERIHGIYNTHACTLPSDVVVENEYETYARYLEKIVAAKATVTFNRSLRDDAAHPETGALQEYKLDEIEVQSGEELQRRYQLSYGYFDADPARSNNTELRLRLDAVQEFGQKDGAMPPHQFEYEQDVQLPDRFSNAIDHWGYYNGETTNADLIPYQFYSGGMVSEIQYLNGANREPNAAMATAGMLEKIVWPTGGSTTFEFETHEYGWVSDMPVEDELTWSESTTVSAFAFAEDPVDRQFFLINGNHRGVATLRVDVEPESHNDPCIECPDPQIRLYSEDHPGEEWLFGVSGTYQLQLSPGNFVLEAHGGTNSTAVSASAALQFRSLDVNTTGTRTAGGVRIREMRHHDGMDSARDIVRQYEYEDVTEDTGESSGVLVSAPAYTYIYNWGGVNGCQCSAQTWMSRASNTLAPIGMTQGSHVGYREVKVLFGEDASAGYTLHRFRSPTDEPDIIMENSTWLLGQRTSYDWRRGLAEAVDTYSADDVLQQSLVQSWDFRDDSETSHSYKGLSTKFVQVDLGNCPTGILSSLPARINRYEIISEWVHLSSETTTVYDEDGGNPLLSELIHEYDNPGHIQLTKRIRETADGRKQVSEFRYPEDFADGNRDDEASAITEMKAQHIHNAVIEQTLSEEDADGNSEVYSATLVTYKLQDNIHVLPHKIYRLETEEPVSDFEPAEIKRTLRFDDRYAVFETADAYDAFGNIVAVSDAMGTPAVYIWQDEGRFPAAFIQNAAQDEVAFQHFETDDESGWKVTAANNQGVETGTVFSGKKAWRVNAHTVSNGKDDYAIWKTFSADDLDDSRTYLFSAWVKAAVACEEMDINIELKYRDEDGWHYPGKAHYDADAGGWQLLETRLDLSTASGLVEVMAVARNYGDDQMSCYWDDMRFYPADALMSTQTIDGELLQVNSSAGHGAEVETFGFDEFGRLISTTNSLGQLNGQIDYVWSDAGGEFDADSPNYIETTAWQAETAYGKTRAYYDGLGRQVQTRRLLGNEVDVRANEYDGQGREYRSWKSFREDSDLGFNADYDRTASDYYSKGGPGADAGGFPFSETRYLQDPLQRKESFHAPGQSYHDQALGQFHQFHYDNNETDELEDPINGGYYPAGTLRKNTSFNENGQEVIVFRDELDNEICLRRDNDGYVDTHFEYDIAGRLLAVRTPNWFDPPVGTADDWKISYQYNALGQQTHSITPDAGERQRVYDRNGNLRFQQDARQRAESKFSFNSYDFANRPTASGEYAGKIAVWDANAMHSWEENTGNWQRFQVYDRAVDATTFPFSLFDVVDFPAEQRHLQGRLSAVAYLSNGSWQGVFYSYDAAGRIVEKTIVNEDFDRAFLTYQYNRQNKLTETGAYYGDHTFYHYYTYNEMGALSDVTTSVEYSGEPQSLLRDASYQYNPDGTVSEIAVFEYDTDTWREQQTYDYHIRGWVSDINNINRTNKPFAAQYDYLANGNIETATFYNQASGLSNQTKYKYDFQYDELNRLLQADYSHEVRKWIPSNRFGLKNLAYDGNGNLLSLERRDEDGSIIDDLSYSYSANNRLSVVEDGIEETIGWDAESSTFSYDANGNIVEVQDADNQPKYLFSYDERQLPIQLTLSDGRVVHYRYNAAGQRIYKKVGEEPAEYYLLDEGKILGVFSASGELIYWNIYGNDLIGRMTYSD